MAGRPTISANRVAEIAAALDKIVDRFREIMPQTIRENPASPRSDEGDTMIFWRAAHTSLQEVTQELGWLSSALQRAAMRKVDDAGRNGGVVGSIEPEELTCSQEHAREA